MDHYKQENIPLWKNSTFFQGTIILITLVLTLNTQIIAAVRIVASPSSCSVHQAGYLSFT